MIQKITQERIWKAPIVTQVAPFSNFYRAEDYHFDYYNHHTEEPYCKFVVAPEIAEFRAKFKPLLKQ